MNKISNPSIGRRQRAFTLIELLVVIAIIGVLASVVIASLDSARTKSRDARRIADIREIQNALSQYSNNNHGQYPTTLATLITDGDIAGVPTDPIGGTGYSYAALLAGGICGSYHLGASLELANNPALTGDADAAANGTVCAGSAADFSGADTAKCNSGDRGIACYDVEI